jgi:hypothetical protein
MSRSRHRHRAARPYGASLIWQVECPSSSTGVELAMPRGGGDATCCENAEMTTAAIQSLNAVGGV